MRLDIVIVTFIGYIRVEFLNFVEFMSIVLDENTEIFLCDLIETLLKTTLS